ncbi:hypothetical protein HZH66_015254 [Vespula vulgaris]|uniref:Uncharacterized protein n=1 Tax=Vespula vulgaris TaxID=7454 RepID=A0A834MMU5_VESVU|nr:uncharacterized protein LOC127072071 [Vespula vulgaris]KAF7379020.1 hypothetical protein HZH66_015254 [Vespula vulgaris]
MNKIGVWTKNTLFQIINNSLKLHTDQNVERIGDPFKSFLNQLKSKREGCWLDVYIPRNPKKNYSIRRPQKNCSFGVLCNRPVPKITRTMAPEIPRKTLPIETKSTNVHLRVSKKKGDAERTARLQREK